MAKVYTINTNCDSRSENSNIFNVQYQKVEENMIYTEVLNTLKKAFRLVDINSILKKH